MDLKITMGLILKNSESSYHESIGERNSRCDCSCLNQLSTDQTDCGSRGVGRYGSWVRSRCR